MEKLKLGPQHCMGTILMKRQGEEAGAVGGVMAQAERLARRVVLQASKTSTTQKFYSRFSSPKEESPSPVQKFHHVLLVAASEDLEPLEVANVTLFELAKGDGGDDGGSVQAEQEELRRVVGLGRPARVGVRGRVKEHVSEQRRKTRRDETR